MFKAPAALNFSTAPNSGLPALSLDRYGLQLDEFRRELPARDMKLLRDGDTRRKAFDSQQDVEAYKRR